MLWSSTGLFRHDQYLFKLNLKRERERERERENIVFNLRFVIFAFSNILFSCILKSVNLLREEPFCVFTDIYINFDVFILFWYYKYMISFCFDIRLLLFCNGLQIIKLCYSQEKAFPCLSFAWLLYQHISTYNIPIVINEIITIKNSLICLWNSKHIPYDK